jgi:hypothetical protein
MLLLPTLAYSQSSSLTFNNPTDGDVTTLRPVIRFSSKEIIDTSTFRMSRLLISDYVYNPPVDGDTVNRDTIVEIYENAPNLLVIPKEVYLEEPDSVFRYLHSPGSFTFTDLTHGEFIPYQLQYNTEYCAILKGVNVLVISPGGYDTVMVSNTSISFTTTNDISDLLRSNINLQINCDDTLKFEFTGKLDSTGTEAGDIIELYSIKSIPTSDSLADYSFTAVNINTWLNNDSTIIYALPSSTLSYDSTYIASVKLARVTGDTADNAAFQFFLRDSYRMSLNAGISSSTVSLPEGFSFYTHYLGDYYYHIDESVTVIAPKYFNAYTFKEWECNQNDNINGNTSRTISFSQSCSLAENYNIKALYEETTTEDVWIKENENLNIKVYNSEGDYIGSSGTYSVRNDGIDMITIEAGNSSSYTFLRWESLDPAFNNITASLINIQSLPSRNPIGIDLDPIDTEIDNNYSLQIQVHFIHNTSYWDDNHDIKDFIYVSPECDYCSSAKKGLCSTFVYASPCAVDIDINTIWPVEGIDCDCYRIERARLDGEFNIDYIFNEPFKVDPDYPHRESWNYGVELDNEHRHRTLFVWINRKWNKLEAELLVNDNRKIGIEEISRLDFKIPYVFNWDNHEMEKVQHSYYDYLHNKHEAWDNYIVGITETDNKRTYDIRYRCQPRKVEVHTKYDNNVYTFDKYNTGKGYYYLQGATEEICDIPLLCEDYTSSTSKKVQAKLDTDFDLLQVGVANVTRNALTYYPKSRIKDVLRNSVVNLRSSLNTVEMDFVFTEPLNPSSVLNKNILFEDQSARIDLPAEQVNNWLWETDMFKYFPGSSSNNYQINSHSILCTLKTDPDFKIPKMEAFQIYITGGANGIKSTLNNTLAYNYNWWAATENAKLTLTLEGIKAKSDLFDIFEGSNAEIYYFYYHCYNYNQYDLSKYELNIKKGPRIYNFHVCPKNEYKIFNYKLFEEEVGFGTDIGEIDFAISFWENNTDPNGELVLCTSTVVDTYIIPTLKYYWGYDCNGNKSNMCLTYPDNWMSTVINSEETTKQYVKDEYHIFGNCLINGSSPYMRLMLSARYGAAPDNPRHLWRWISNLIELQIKYEVK